MIVVLSMAPRWIAIAPSEPVWLLSTLPVSVWTLTGDASVGAVIEDVRFRGLGVVAVVVVIDEAEDDAGSRGGLGREEEPLLRLGLEVRTWREGFCTSWEEAIALGNLVTVWVIEI